MRTRIGVGIIGFGTVGTGAVKVLLENAELIRRRVGVPVEIARVADLDTTADRGVMLPAGVLTADARDVLEDPAVDIVVELVGGYDVAKKVMLTAMASGKHVVTANKALLSVHGEELFNAAQRHGVDLRFEASVAGGIPVIRALTEGLSANKVVALRGIINGTANYILTRMTRDALDFDKALAQAQQAGYAEADPTLDVAGIDAAHKLSILVTLAYGTPVNVKEVYTEGITHLTPLDIAFAREFGYTVKLLAIAKLVDGDIEARIHPTMVPTATPLAQVNGVYNAVQLVGDASEDILLYGQGAGAMPTGSAVVSDVIDVARNVLAECRPRIPAASYQLQERIPLRIRPMDEIATRYYLRFMVVDRPGVLSQISGVLGSYGISISAVLQTRRHEGHTVPVVIMTHAATEREVQAALQDINQLTCVSEPTTLVRVENQDSDRVA